MKCVRVDSERDTEAERMGDRLIADPAKSKQRIRFLCEFFMCFKTCSSQIHSFSPWAEAYKGNGNRVHRRWPKIKRMKQIGEEMLVALIIIIHLWCTVLVFIHRHSVWGWCRNVVIRHADTLCLVASSSSFLLVLQMMATAQFWLEWI